MEDIRKKIYAILEKESGHNIWSKIIETFIMTLILLNIFAIVFETVKSISDKYHFIFRIFEYFSVIVFSAEYLTRIWICTLNDKYNTPFFGRIRYMFTPLALVDLLAILPFYLPFIVKLDLRFIRAIRLLRLLRLLKIGRYSESMMILGSVFKRKKEELIIVLFALFILLIIISSIMYYIEGPVQPQLFSSIPAAMWWGMTTLTTVGYGDMYPVTPLGKFFGAIIALLGIGMFALPAGILGSGFIEEIDARRKKAESLICPYCKKKIPIRK